MPLIFSDENAYLQSEIENKYFWNIASENRMKFMRKSFDLSANLLVYSIKCVWTIVTI